ncbi:YnfC family lipoprotein [Streptomyces sp. LP05-1]|uniref:YnfC family lipoprotein n=1 Tax=Streptomyces pyxinae TaxID=2970734 RepID=A0ABT2CKA3_9ACTN|nr:YnfC family lipoprotein [Streptomyces sp. LP05-1]MCS0637858.1 YnfC family lipoprotein [Streptomyces sp. LP05-1]
MLIAKLLRSRWGKIVALALIMVVGVGSLAVAGVGIPLFPEPLPGARGPGQWSGSAEGRAHVVLGRGNREVPLSLRAKYPTTVSAPARPEARGNAVEVTPPPAPEVTGFDRKTSKELPGERDERSRTYLNEDGTRTTELAAAPLNFRDDKGQWRPIEPDLVERSGGWDNSADAVGVRIADRADAGGLVTLTLPAGEVFGYGLDGAATSTGEADGSRVAYEKVLPETDLWLDSRAGGVKETLVLRSAGAPGAFDFPLRTTGLTARLDGGTVVLSDPAGRTRAVVPAGFMEDAKGAVSAAVRYDLIERNGGQTLRVTPDRTWLTDPARAFPVRVDPSVDTSSATTSMYVRSGGSVVGSGELHVGKGPEGATAAYLGFPGLETRLKNHQIFGAQLQVVNYDSASCRPRPVSVHPVTESWTAGTGSAYPGPSVGSALASRSFAYGYIGLGQPQSDCPAAGELFDLGKAGRDLVQRWADGTQPNNGLSLRASPSDPLGFKKFAGHGTANPPRLYITHSPYNATYTFPKPVPDPPVMQNQAGKVKITVTNKGAETWTPSTYYLAYRVYNSKGKLVGQQRSANLTGNVANGAKVTLDATIKALPPGGYLVDFTMVRAGGKVFTDEQVPPGRLTLQVFDIAPVVKEQFPPNGYQAQTLTPQLWAAGVDADAPAGLKLQYKFEICEADKAGKPTGCTTSAYQPGSAYPVPAGRLKWGKTYLWRGFVKDASTEVPTAQLALITAVPQPEITSRLSEAQGQEFDANVGNYTTRAVDASLAGVGPDLTLVRTYNSLDPRRDLAFGAGWTSRYDMRLTPDDDGTGNVVIRYPEGQDVRFGKNADGTFTPPPGRFAKLTADTATGSYRLQDKSGTGYDFGSSGLLTKITDSYGKTVSYTYTGGRLATAVNNRTNRSLTFTWTGAHVTKVSTGPVGGAPLTWTYTYDGDRLTKVCDPQDGCTLYDHGTGSHYRTTVLDARPESYWRLGEEEGTAAASENPANLGKDRGTYTGVTLKTPGAIAGDPGTAASFNGSGSRVTLPSGTLKKSRDAAVEVWFRTLPTGVGGPLVGYQDKAWGTAPATGVPMLYVGTDGKLRGQFWTGAAAPVTDIGKNVNDGKWHHAVLSVAGTTQSLYLDGKLSGTSTGKQLLQSALTYNQIGAAHASAPGSWPGWGTTGARSFAGAIDDVAVYHHPLGASAVAAHYREGGRAADQVTRVTMPTGRTASEVTYDTALDRVEEYTDRNGGTWRVGTPAVFGDDKDLRRTVEVRDPMNGPRFYEYDGLSSRLLRYGEPTALTAREPVTATPSPTPTGPVEVCTTPDPGDPQFCTTPPAGSGSEPDFIRYPVDGVAIRSFAYDDNGFQTAITSENGDTISLGHDDRGNVTSRTTCRAKDDCQTAYTTYPATTDDFDLRADQPVETRDGRSSGPADNRYLTKYTYNTYGGLVTQTSPDGGTVTHTYTTGAEPAAGGGGGMPAGLPLTTKDPRGKITRYAYFANGDLASTTEPSGEVTRFTYDTLGRKITETAVTDVQPGGVTRTYTYDQLSRLVSTTDPAATNVVTLAKHQQRTVTDYDGDGNVLRTEVSDATVGGDPARVMTFDLDDRGRPEKVTDAEGNETSYTYDVFGNKTSMTDANGNRYEFSYTARNLPAETRLRDWDDDGGDEDYTVLKSYAYDLGGRMARETDSMGRTSVYAYYGDDSVRSVTLKDFHNPDGTKRDQVLSALTYDGAGNVLAEKSANGKVTTQYTYDAVGRKKSEVTDPTGVARRTSYTYDLAGNVESVVSGGLVSNVPWPVSTTGTTVRYSYDDAGNTRTESIEDGTQSRTTTYAYDQRGLLTSETDPAGSRTDYGYDEIGRQVSATSPAVETESDGSSPLTSRPVVYTGYDTFGSVTESVDALGRTSRTGYDRLGRPVTASAAPYKAPGSDETVTPATTTVYDPLGNVTESTDPLGRTSRFRYDRQNRLTVKDLPVGTGDDRAQWKYTYTRADQVLSVTDPNGARAESTYDDLDRPVTQTRIERTPVPAAFTTRHEYDDAGNVLKTTAPGGGITRYAHDGLGQVLRVTEPSGVRTEFGYDIAGREVRSTDGKGRTEATWYDQFGQVTRDADLDATNSPLREVSYAYDKAGNVLSATDADKHSTTYTYDALGRLKTQTEPVSDTRTITTSFGYDALGNRTRYTDGRGNTTVYTTNALGLPESVIEPVTQRHPAPADRTWTTSYDAAGQAVKVAMPGKVVRERSYDKAGALIRETGSGAEATTPEKRFQYDAAGQLVKASAPKGDNTYEYNDRGNLVKASGPSGNATYDYDADSLLLSRTDASGTAAFTYTDQRLSSAQDPVTGVRQSYGYDGAGKLEKIGYSAGQSRTFTYDNLGRLGTDTVKSSGGATVTSTDYGYDSQSRLTSKKTTGTAKAGTNTYGYDYAGRMTSWTADGKTVGYAWDDSGNRVKNGDKTATFDERDRLLSDGDYTYDHTPRGTVASRISSGLKEEFAFDAFDRLTKAGESGTEYTYDALDRVAARNGTDFVYEGTSPDPVKDNSATYGRGAGGELMSVLEGDTARLSVADAHGDVVGSMSATDGAAASLEQSTAYDPFGVPTAATEVAGNLGYQGDYTDPDTDQVNMGARWYNPGSGSFDSRDTYQYSSGASVLANRYTYGSAAPMNYSDPDGHWSCSWCSWAGDQISSGYHKVKRGISQGYNKAKQGLSWGYNKAKQGLSWGYNKVTSGAQYVWNAVTHPRQTLSKVWDAVYRGSGLKTVVDTGSRLVRKYGGAGVRYLHEKAAETRQRIYQAKVAITVQARSVASFAAKHNPIPAIKAALRPLVAVGVQVVTAVASVPAMVVAAQVNVVKDMARAADDFRKSVVAKTGYVMETVKESVDWGAVWEGTKTVANVVGEVTGFNDIKNCVTQGDMEACAWAAATVGGLVLGGAGAGAVRAARMGRLATKVAAHSDDIAALSKLRFAGKAERAADKVDDAGDAAQCMARANSFVAGTEVVLADGSRKPIEEVREGDQVLATDPTTGKSSKQEVTATIVGKGQKQLVRLTVDTDGDRGGATDTITATKGHPFWVPDLKKWLTAGELKPGQWLQTGSGSWVQVDAVRAWTQQAAVYNLTVDTAHTYYVLAGATSVLVHNCNGANLELTYKPDWTPEQIAAADAKVAALNDAPQLVVTKVNRSGSAAEVWRRAGNNTVPGTDIDHKIDLQLGGADNVSNMWPLDSSVNRSLGPQISGQMKRQGLQPGDLVCSITITVRRC